MSKAKIGILISVIAVVLITLFYIIGSQNVDEGPLGFGGFVSFGETGVTNSSSTVTTAASGTAVVALNHGRIYLHLANAGTEDVYLIFDTLNQTSEYMYVGQGLLLAPDQHYEIGPDNLYLGGITGISASGSMVVSIIEK